MSATPKARGKQAAGAADAEIGRRVRLRRVEMGMSQEIIGKSIGLTFQQVQKYENGTNRISSGRLQQIAGVLKVPMSYFFEDIKNADGAPDALGFLALPGAVQIAKDFGRVKDAKLRQAIREMVRQLADYDGRH